MVSQAHNWTYEDFAKVMQRDCRASLSEKETALVLRIASELKEFGVQNNQIIAETKERRPSAARMRTTVKPQWRRGQKSTPPTHHERPTREDPRERLQNGKTSKNDWRVVEVPKKKTTVNKQINLILNSVVEENSADIIKRMCAVVHDREQTLPASELYQKIMSQLMVNAFAQALYSESYVSIVCALQADAPDTVNVFEEIWQKCFETVEGILSGNDVQKHQVKGLGTFIAHMYMNEAIEEAKLLQILRSVMQGLTADGSQKARELCCEILVSSLQRIIQKSTTGATKYPESIQVFIQDELTRIWDSADVPMRIRIRLLDIKDIY